jgi:lipopolysaccharide biosynthesis glycosyltransferase
MSLVYYTLGYNIKYLDLLELSIKSLKKFYRGDVAVICDEQFVHETETKIPDIQIFPIENSKSPEASSINKLKIFNYDIQKYSKLMFIDSDILIHTKLDKFFNSVTKDVLYVYSEKEEIEMHNNLHWGFCNYTPEQIEHFRENSIKVFNAGFFMLNNSQSMREHFSNILEKIKNHRGYFYYEQSFMNAYFNMNNQTDRTAITNENYVMFPKEIEYEGKLIHVCGDAGNATPKYEIMSHYYNTYLRNKIIY